MTRFKHIDKPGQLRALVDELATQERIAIDTEFLRERTYYPVLCLVQIATDSGIALIDPLALEDLAPLAELFADTRITKVLHAGRQDSEILLARTGVLPRPLFDTQIAAALVGHGAQVSYAALVERLLGVRLSKAHTRTDWTRRPLTSEQQAYAADDVRHLLQLEARLAAELEARGRAGWAAAELEALNDETLYRSAPGDAWRRLKGLRGLEATAHAAARSLAAWRERQAMTDDRPRQWVLRDAALLDLARASPRAAAELADIPHLPGGFARRHGRELVGLMAEARAASPREAGGPPPPLDPAQKSVLARLAHEVRACAAQHDLGPELLATRSELERLVCGEEELPVLRGWRRDVIGERLLRLLGSSSLRATSAAGGEPSRKPAPD